MRGSEDFDPDAGEPVWTDEEWAALAREMAGEGDPRGTRDVHIGEAIYTVIDDPSDPDDGLRIGID